MASKLKRILLAASAAALTLSFAGSGQAALHTISVEVNPTQLQCGFFARSGICAAAGLTLPSPITPMVGDEFRIHVDMTSTLYVPGSRTSAGIFVDAYDATATLGPGGPGPYGTTYRLTPTGLVTSPGDPAPFTGFGTANRSYDHIGYMGYFNGTDSNGFSVEALDARLIVTALGPRPIVGVSTGYFYTLDEIPQTFEDLAGGTEDSPLILPDGLTGQINGAIGGGVEEQFYNFFWQGGTFQTRVNVEGAEPGSEFTFRLAGTDGTKFANTVLDAGNNYLNTFTAVLPSGRYNIGILAGDVPDPMFTFDFLTPIGAAIPEPQTWALMLMGFGGLGAALRRRRQAAAPA